MLPATSSLERVVETESIFTETEGFSIDNSVTNLKAQAIPNDYDLKPTGNPPSKRPLEQKAVTLDNRYKNKSSILGANEDSSSVTQMSHQVRVLPSTHENPLSSIRFDENNSEKLQMLLRDMHKKSSSNFSEELMSQPKDVSID